MTPEPRPPEPRQSWPEKLLLGALAYLLMAFAVLPFFIPPTPRTAAGWLALILLAPPVYLGLEWLFEKIGSMGKGNVFLKILKVILFIVVGLVVLFIGLLFG